MIEAKCGCGWTWAQAEAAAKPAGACGRCGKALSLACAETLPAGAGGGDFDAVLDVVAGPGRVGERIFLGGVTELAVGKLAGSQILLQGAKVSRRHCRLERVDFGPSQWSVSDNESTNGLFVNGRRVGFKRLEDGDVIRVGEFDLKFGHAEEVRAPAATPRTAPLAERPAGIPTVAPGTGVVCPSCENELPARAKICVGCGIKLDTGRPILLSADTDENAVHVNSETWIKLLSWIVWVTPLPIPLKSEAFGTRKPWAVRGIAAVTVIASILFLIGSLGTRTWDVPGKQLELWPPGGANVTAAASSIKLKPSEVRKIIRAMDEEQRQEFQEIRERLRGTVPDGELDARAIQEMVGTLLGDFEPEMGGGEFRPYQLLTHAFLHDNGSIIGCAMHLGGNLLFLLVFGTCVNALLGNVATLVIYPVLAAGAAGAHLWLGGAHGPMLGASGAIMGLAGMYLVLFPVHRVYCGMWFRFRWWCAMKIFAVRGFWVLLIYFGYDALMVGLRVTSGTAHWAHLGGFLLGVTIALGLLVSRQFNCGGGDLLSVALGRRAWGLIGRPARWTKLAA